MGLMEDIEEEIEKTKMPKWRILKDVASKEIVRMIDNGITIDRQIELIIKNKIVEKLDRKEYTNILKKHFGYQGRNQKKSTNNNTSETLEKAIVKKVEKSIKNKDKSIEEKLSEDVDLLEMHLKKKAESQ